MPKTINKEILIILFLIVPRYMKQGKKARANLGKDKNVPEKVGTKNDKIAKIKYELLIFSLIE